MTWTIRSAGPADARVVAQLNEVVQSLHSQHHPDRFGAPDADRFLPVVEEWLSNEAVRVLVVEDDSPAVVGYVVAIRSQREGNALVKAASVVELDQLVVAPAARGQGVGTDLCNAVLGWAAECSADRVELSTWAFNEPAQALFARLGFAVDSVRMSRSAMR